ncbi:ADP-ribosylglycohydrolase family protein [Paenibacillus sp. N3.4]|uniref:ADP-ribosylglycohydrolase family protein n=1 Tax=Paenibacillus sp. N3.4 TaxID=2603222 RepID=UPI0011CA63DD|nr:ADP-ribosylglycohydrolase family protein [Paenibacillus sp. N3.4]TXK76730.1 ADP-ribosylglycohydrolase family protein [Paenibacillus sp. N3.4]
MLNTWNKYLGCFIGLAVGDALGTTVEFQQPGSFPPVEDIVGGGIFDLNPGEWTDDTSMALCLAESLVDRCGFDPMDQMSRYRRWFREGYLSSTGECFDIGNTVRAAILQFERTGEGFCGSVHPSAAGNGSIMRLAPVPLFFMDYPHLAIDYAVQSSKITHSAAECLDACRLLTVFIIGALNGWTKERLMKPDAFRDWLQEDSLTPKIKEIATGSYLQKEPPEIIGSGYVVKSLEAALWAFAKGNSFEEGVLLAVNLGNDADTTGAIYGQIAGAYYGYDHIPKKWTGILAKRSFIEELSRHLYDHRYKD